MRDLLLQFSPSLRARGVTEITPSFLAGRGIRALILDLDNTLVPWHGKEVAEEIAGWIAAMQGAGIGMCIVSNTHRPGRLKALAARLGVGFVPSGGKPRRRGFYRALAALGTAAAETAVVGDQVMTDIWGGNRCGLLTILVEPISPIEFWGTRVLNRRLERLFLTRLEGWGVRPETIAASPAGRDDEQTEGNS